MFLIKTLLFFVFNFINFFFIYPYFLTKDFFHFKETVFEPNSHKKNNQKKSYQGGLIEITFSESCSCICGKRHVSNNFFEIIANNLIQSLDRSDKIEWWLFHKK